MKIYLATVTIIDGEHEHSAYALIKADTIEDAGQIAQAEIDKQESEDPFGADDESRAYWSYGDGLTRTKLSSVEVLSKSEVKVISRLGLAWYLN